MVVSTNKTSNQIVLSTLILYDIYKEKSIQYINNKRKSTSWETSALLDAGTGFEPATSGLWGKFKIITVIKTIENPVNKPLLIK